MTVYLPPNRPASALPTHAHPSRGRRSSRPSGDDRELAILTTAERLLAERPLSEISVDDLAKGAGISRPTFYFYFPSKDAVLLTLYERVIVEADSTLEGRAEQVPADPTRAWRDGIYAFFDAFKAHQAVAMAAATARAMNPEIHALWSKFMQKWIDFTASLIASERARGAAPDTIPAKDLATALNLMNDRTMLASYAGEQPCVPTSCVLDTLVHIWVTSIYGTTP